MGFVPKKQAKKLLAKRKKTSLGTPEYGTWIEKRSISEGNNKQHQPEKQASKQQDPKQATCCGNVRCLSLPASATRDILYVRTGGRRSTVATRPFSTWSMARPMSAAVYTSDLVCVCVCLDFLFVVVFAPRPPTQANNNNTNNNNRANTPLSFVLVLVILLFLLFFPCLLLSIFVVVQCS